MEVPTVESTNIIYREFMIRNKTQYFNKIINGAIATKKALELKYEAGSNHWLAPYNEYLKGGKESLSKIFEIYINEDIELIHDPLPMDTQVDSGEVFYHINLDMIKSSTQSCLSSGYTGLSGSPIENITVSETSVDWSNDIQLTITGEVSSESDAPVDLSEEERLVLNSVILKLPRRRLLNLR